MLASCGGGGGGGGSMAITACSLGCNNSGGTQISCGVTDVYMNQELQIRFTQPIDALSVSNNSFQMTELSTGKTPAGSFLIAPLDPTLLIYRPQLTFDSSGAPIFGLEDGKTYFLKVPGTALDPLGPYIKSTVGTPNSSRLQCTIVASRGVFDSKPGRPRVTMTVDKVVGYDPQGNPTDFELDVPATEQTDVYRASPVRMVFDDVMNPATLANPVTGFSSTIEAFVDADGDVSNPSDRVPLQGVFTLTVDQNALRTTVIFTPSGGFPSAGVLPDTRRIVMQLSAQITDLGGNTLINPGTTNFTTERIDFDEISIVEPFNDAAREDAVRTGSRWAGGQLATGPGGGSGRLGDLIVPSGQVVVLDTDSEDFADITNLNIFNPGNVIDRPANLVVTGGVFEFSRLRIDAGAVLRFTGSNPARIYVRGECVIQGLIDVSGSSGVLHVSSLAAGGLGGASGPSGGAGGKGGDLPDGQAFSGIGGSDTDAGPSNVNDPSTYFLVNGEAGGGIAFPSQLDPQELVAGGGGGLAWPQPTTSNPTLHFPASTSDYTGLQPEVYQECRNNVPSAPGGGGGNALTGGIGDAVYGGIPVGPIFLVTDSEGGDADDLAIDDAVKSLDPHLGFLRGGGGGGGGGSHLQGTQVNGLQLVNCAIGSPSGAALRIIQYSAHSSAGGGGGGGAVQIAAGRRLIHNGVIDASGGDGGSGTFPPPPENPNDLAQAGGGGAGGSVLLQSQVIQIQSVPRRIDVSGGIGGDGTGSAFPIQPSRGGNGSPGFLRLESIPAPVRAIEAAKVVPLESTLEELFPGATLDDFFTTALWQPAEESPSSWSGAQSCWIRPEGNFFRIEFLEDGTEPGWDLALRITGFAEPQSFRGENDLFPGQTLEEVWGNDFGSAPVVVRFQGARATGSLVDPCAVVETGNSSPLRPGSITEWLRHPSELNDYFTEDALAPNLFRFVVLWDKSQVDFDGIEALEELSVRIQPD